MKHQFACRRKSALACLFALILFSSKAFAGVSTSQLECHYWSISDLAPVKKSLGKLIEKNKNLGRIEGVVVTFIAPDTNAKVRQDNYMNLGHALLNAVAELGVSDAEASVELKEAAPANYGCPNSPLAVDIKFIYKYGGDTGTGISY